jgi:hypothetical protein
MVNSLLCSSTMYFENRLLPNDLIIVRNHGDDEENEQDIKRVLERKEMRTPRWRSNPVQNYRA